MPRQHTTGISNGRSILNDEADSYDNAMAEIINGLYKAEVIHRQSWKTRQDVELATLKWVDWYNHHLLMERTGYIPPAEAEKAYYASLNNRDVAA